MYADYHLHSEFSDDSRAPLEAQIERAIALGLDELCFTDHVDYGIKRDWDDPRGIAWRDGDGISSGSEEKEPLANVNYPEYFAKLARMRAIYGEQGVKAGFTTGPCREDLMQALEHLVQRGAEVAILGCTELPLILAMDEHFALGGQYVVLIDLTTILARWCVALARG